MSKDYNFKIPAEDKIYFQVTIGTLLIIGIFILGVYCGINSIECIEMMKGK